MPLTNPPSAGGGAPTDADYLVGTANGTLSAEIVVGTTPGGELGGTWASPTVDATHSGSSHAGVVSTHEAAADPHTGYVLESLFDAKGDLIAGSADNTPAKVTVGANDTILMADSGQTAGLKWVAAATPSTQAFADAAAEGTADTYTRGDHKHAMPTLGFGLTGNSAPAVSLTTASAFATATTTVSAATYADITGCSVSLDAGTWLILAHVVGGAANAITQGFVAITHSDNTVIAESAMSRPASGTASLNSPMSASWFGIVTPGSTTTYKLRAARGVTTHTASWTVYDGNGVNTANHATNNSDKGTSIIAVRLA